MILHLHAIFINIYVVNKLDSKTPNMQANAYCCEFSMIYNTI